jgi:peptidoglycan-associated lipoprotein
MKKFLATTCTVVLLAACSCGHKISGSAAGNSTVARSGLDAVRVAGLNDDLRSSQDGDRVFFAFDSRELTATAKETLNRQAEFIKQHANVPFVIEGHADERGTREYNLGLGERRADSVKQYLIQQGVDANRLTTVSYGKERPAAVGHDQEAWKQNRRAVTIVAAE